MKLAHGVFVGVLLTQGVAMATEEPKFTVQATGSGYEIRVYPELLVAETVVQEGFENAGNSAFRILADYIFGNNTSATKIAMTAPVTQQAASEKIAMTAPVTQTQSGEGFVVQFTMPSDYTMATLPKPNDARVTLRALPARHIAVYTYSGSWSQERYQEKLADFRTGLQKDGIQTTGEPTLARYNSPFALWFLRRNEIWFDVVASKPS